MTVALCIPTRGRPQLLSEAVSKAISASKLPDTRVVIGYDEDDSVRLPINDAKVIASIAPREDSVGAKYNRLFRLHPADIYVQGVDDLTMADGWDESLVAANRFKDGIGIIYFGSNAQTSGSLPGSFALTHKFLELIGGFPEQFPFWWYDTWVNEIGVMTGCITFAPIDVHLIDGRGKTRGCRDIAFWQHLFDELRPSRIVTAGKIINTIDESDQKKALLYYQIGAASKALHQMGSHSRDPIQAKLLEAHQGYDAPADDRYKRIKNRAEAWLAGRV